MTVGDHLAEFGGLPAFDFPADDPEFSGKLPEADSVAWRIGVDTYETEKTWAEAFEQFLEAVDSTAVRALIVGSWAEIYETGPEEIFDALIAAKDRLPAMRALFVGDVVGEQCEISWIHQGEATLLLDAFPELTEFGVRGGEELRFPAVRHERLRKLTVETGGMPAEVVRGIAASDLPALTHLDLWLGTAEYGGDADIDDLAPILAGTRLPSLKHLGLRNSEIQDDICAALASAPVVVRLEVLDVSMGVLTDDGVAALLTGQPLSHLTFLDLHHNYLSDAMRTRLAEALEPAGVRLDMDPGDAESDEDEDDGTVWRFVAVGE
ncbi:STM4015 family protein [Nocardia tenerifensis]|uniref:STM4015 family protein n=1 Tax=Nocardia tenerifensis TaxID=228006 RepID=UPI00031CD1D8|nr:STM4015 family protein [Nocardia tenerifensis]